MATTCHASKSRECGTIGLPDFRMHMDAEHLRILRAMTPQQKLRTMQRLYDTARELKAAWLRTQHPDWGEAAIQRAVRDAFLYARS